MRSVKFSLMRPDDVWNATCEWVYTNGVYCIWVRCNDVSAAAAMWCVSLYCWIFRWNLLAKAMETHNMKWNFGKGGERRWRKKILILPWLDHWLSRATAGSWFITPLCCECVHGLVSHREISTESFRLQARFLTVLNMPDDGIFLSSFNVRLWTYSYTDLQATRFLVSGHCLAYKPPR